MFEAKLEQASLLKKLLDSIKELVTEANIDVASTGLSLQAMDSAHVSLVSLLMEADGFEMFRADRSLSLGINMAAMAKILKCAGNDDKLTLKAEDKPDTASFVFESRKGDRTSDFELKLMDIDGESLAIPDTKYSAVIKMPSAEFQRICRDLTSMGDTVIINAEKSHVKFSVDGEHGKGNIVCRPTASADEKEKDGTTIALVEPVNLSFALRYLNMFTKATALSDTVVLSLSPEVPLVVEYPLHEVGFLRFYLAPKIDDDN